MHQFNHKFVDDLKKGDYTKFSANIVQRIVP